MYELRQTINLWKFSRQAGEMGVRWVFIAIIQDTLNPLIEGHAYTPAVGTANPERS